MTLVEGKNLTVNVNKHIYIFNKDINSYPITELLFAKKKLCTMSLFVRKKLTDVYI